MHDNKKTILHVTEVTSGGVLPIIVMLSNYFSLEYNVVVAYGVRMDTPANLETLFDNKVKLVRIQSFTRDISIRKDILALKELRSLVKQIKPDYIHFHSSKAGYIGRLGLLNYKCIKFYTPHGYSFSDTSHGRLKNCIFWWAEKILSHTGCMTIACGNNEFKISKLLTDNAVCIENGLDTQFVDEVIKDVNYEKHPFTVYSSGRICAVKKPEFFNEVAKLLPDINFVWIGGGDSESLTEKNISVTGVLKREDAIKAACTFDVFLLCSESEGLSVALQEAMYLGKACVVRDIDANKELIDDLTGYYFKKMEDCVEIIRSIMMNYEKTNERRIRARDRIVNEYNALRMCRKYDEVLRGG